MAYIGPEPNPGQNREVDDISSGFNGSEVNFTLQVNSQNVSPGSSNAIIVSVGGVIQNPGTDYTVAASTLTFTTNPASGLSFFGLVLGQQVDTEGFADGGTLNNPVITGDLSIADKIVHTGDTNTAIRFPANDTISFETSGGEQLRISSSGQVLSGLTTAHSTVLANQTPKIQLESTSVSGSSMFLLRDGNDAGGPFLFLGHGRGGSGLVQSGDELGQITFVGGEGSTFQNAAAIKSFVDGTPGSGTDMPGRLAFFTSPDGSTTMAERMRIDSSGVLNVGATSYSGGGSQPIMYIVGTSGRQVKIHNTNSGTCALQLSNAGTGEGDDAGLMLSSLSDGQANISNAESANLLFGTNNTTRVKITSNGSFIQHGEVFYATSTVTTSGGVPFGFYTGGSSVDSIGSVKCRIHGDGDIENVNGNYGSISDIKLKENIVDANSQWDDIKAIKIRNYNFKAETTYSTHTQIGLIAQELELVCPKLVTETPDVDSENKELGTVTKSVNLSVLYMKAVKCLQEAMTKIEVLETKVAALEAA